METHNEAVALALERIAQAVEGINYALAGVVKTEDVGRAKVYSEHLGKTLRPSGEGDSADLVRSMQEAMLADTLLNALKAARPYVYGAHTHRSVGDFSIHRASKADLAMIDAALATAEGTAPSRPAEHQNIDAVAPAEITDMFTVHDARNPWMSLLVRRWPPPTHMMREEWVDLLFGEMPYETQRDCFAYLAIMKYLGEGILQTLELKAKAVIPEGVRSQRFNLEAIPQSRHPVPLPGTRATEPKGDETKGEARAE